MSHSRSLAIIAIASLSLTLSACDGCKKAETPEPAPEVKTPPPAPDMPPAEDPLKEATADAEAKASAAALAILDAVALVGAEIEGMNAKPTTVASTKIKQVETGSIDAKAAGKVFRDYDGAMRKCYERTLKKKPGLEGQLLLTLIVSPDGKVKSARAGGDLGDEVESCAERLASEMVFPKPEGGAARILKPYKFTPAL